MPSAGEVEQFAYCAHNWLLARTGVDPAGDGSKRGIRDHRAMGVAQGKVESDKKEYRYAWQAALSLTMFAMALILGALAARLRGTGAEIVALVVVTIMLALGSAGLLTLALFAQRDYTRRTRKARLVPGALVASDLAGEAPLLTDKAWDLQGRPDYILQTKSGQVPVEVKTGRTPQRPYDSHRLQVACYLRLVESAGNKPEFGLITYPDGTFRVEWDDKLRSDLKDLLGRMREARKTGKADRDHDQPSRCKGCARRDACDQKLA